MGKCPHREGVMGFDNDIKFALFIVTVEP